MNIAYNTEETKGKLLEILRKNEEGMTITDMTKVLKINYSTVSKYLAVLEAEKKVESRNIGMAKLFKIAKGGSRSI